MASAKDEGSMLQQAQHIWQMLDDMAQNDPQAYRKFIDTQRKEGMKAMKPPEPHMCVQTTILNGCRIYMNVCEWHKITEPKSDEDPIPVMGGDIYDAMDDNGQYKLISIAFHPKVLEDFGRDSPLHEERKLLINLAIDYIQDMYKLKLSRSYFILPKKDLFKGPKQKVITSLTKRLKASDKQFEDELGELEKSFGPLATGCKDSLLREMANISISDQSEGETKLSGLDSQQPEISLRTDSLSAKKEKKLLIEEISSLESNRKEPQYDLQVKENDGDQCKTVVIRIELPGIKSVTECDLDISEDDIYLEAGNQFELQLKLPENINEDLAAAKFSKKNSTLTLTLPVL